MKFKGVLGVIRAPFLLLALVLGFLGASIAWYEHQKYAETFNLGYAFLAGFGLLIAHACVNTWNEYFDYRSKVDFRTPRTPFSGGSGALPAGLLTEKQALCLGIVTLAVAATIGIFFTVTVDILLLPLLIGAGVIIIIYTPIILKMGYPEWAAGLGLGTLPVIGAYFVHGGAYHAAALIAAIPSGILVHNLLLLNEVPDADADKSVGRRTLPIVLGRKNAVIVYSSLQVVMYLWIIGAVLWGDMPSFTLLGLLTLPLGFKAIRGGFQFAEMNKLVPALANNVFVVLLTQLLMGIGFILAGIFQAG